MVSAWKRALPLLAAIWTTMGAPAARAQAGVTDEPPSALAPTGMVHEQSRAEALAQDASAVAALLGIDVPEAKRRLVLQEASVSVTEALAQRWQDRLAGMAFEQEPDFHLLVVVTGPQPVADEEIRIGNLVLPVRYRSGALATRTAMLAALTDRREAMLAALGRPAGLGLDQRRGMLVAVVPGALARDPVVRERVGAVAGVPVLLRASDDADADMSDAAPGSAVEGGARVTGLNPVDGHRYACTTGFAVTDGTREGVVTAAHCPDSLSYLDTADRTAVPLTMVGQWGWGYQDVQVHTAPVTFRPLFFSDTGKTVARPVTAARTRAATRAGELVCHRGERTGYSCAAVELTDFAPAGDLCGGACLPTWVTVGGPTCKGGDSGAPVFAGTTAFGIVKGGTYRPDGSCSFYFYMSVDYLPAGWTLLRAGEGGGEGVGELLSEK
jgi:streptogrisin C